MEDQEIRSCTHCQHIFAGKFCPQCGQSVRIYEKPIMSFLREFLGDVFAFDSRLWRSIPALLWKPGTMVSEYVGGKHAAYVPPFRMYVFVSFVFFLVLDATTTRNIEEKAQEFKQQLVQDSILQDSKHNLSGDSLSLSPEMSQEREDSLALHKLNIQIGGQDSLQMKLRIQEILAKPALYISKFNKNLSWSLFLLMPILGFFFWLLMRKNRPFYVPHFLFAIQLHIALFLVLTIFMGVELLWPGLIANTGSYIFWILPVHAIAGAKKLFGFSWLATVLRLSLATILYLICVLWSAVLMALYIFTS
jgi:hypothetical protein